MSSIPEGCRPFNLQEALAGKPVVTRDGFLVKIAGYNPDVPNEDFRLLGWLSGRSAAWNDAGIFVAGDINDSDLFMAPETMCFWIVVWIYGGVDRPMTATYNSEFDAVETEKSLIQRGVQTFGVHKITYNYNDNITPNMLEKENTPASFKSAVDWIIEEVNGFSWPAGYGTSLSIDISKETIDKAKEIEKNQLIRFAMAAYQNISRLKGVPENLISENKYLFEDYFQKWENEK